MPKCIAASFLPSLVIVAELWQLQFTPLVGSGEGPFICYVKYQLLLAKALSNTSQSQGD